MIENELSKKIIGCAIEVHKQLGQDFWNRPIRNVFSMN